MAVAINVPRVNNNDDEVKLVQLNVAVGQRVEVGEIVAEVETDKAVVEIEAPAAGYVLALRGEIDTQLRVGSVLIWLGETAEEAVPDEGAAAVSGDAAAAGAEAAPTAKALLLLRRHGLHADQVPTAGARLTAADVEAYVARRGSSAAPAGGRGRAPEASASSMAVAGSVQALASHERGMLATVSWQRDHAVPGYIEIEYDQAPWASAAKQFQSERGGLLSPLLPLMAAKLARLARDNPKINATLVEQGRYEFGQVNLGFTVQVGEVLYLTVVEDAAQKEAAQVVTELVELQRLANAHKLSPQQCTGATLGFSSMARWKVGRHIPVLSPYTSLMVAHTAVDDERGVLGATYDHRVLTGADVVKVLKLLSKP
ncbi:2-oxo acid dehydrogenase subunit E2 [Paucibacter sp. APW11]|uniref:Dihydrolipoamide acetyltransferase component of pyruvate dehydrogenase complex n=1 Tax=Roseateles aquae TaxID=3077235 RepID=A0ABU3P9A7_9BURK|nr:2-oxo acid dehydrogenase subunit E2 [Paucibacter sp. APW11]MDT8998805.1 2-oxo acid dehydrogenase subunit E2 [Paucibacter sp. APW11]